MTKPGYTGSGRTLLFASLLTILALTGCAKPYEQAQKHYNSTEGRITAVERLGKKPLARIDSEIVISPEDIQNFNSYCQIEIPANAQETRRASARRDALAKLASEIDVGCLPSGKRIECKVNSLGTNPSNPNGTFVGTLYVDSESQQIVDSRLMNAGPIEAAVTSAITDNYFSSEEKDCRKKILYELSKKKLEATARSAYDGLRNFWNNTVNPALESGIQKLKDAYSSQEECLAAGNSAADCLKAGFGVKRDSN
ncbi:Uncharacterised protein [uncultured archaeon]|nr:Uncharacterised protein [uncultured archaeon]